MQQLKRWADKVFKIMLATHQLDYGWQAVIGGLLSGSISVFRTIGLQLSWNMGGRHSLGPAVLSIDCVFNDLRTRLWALFLDKTHLRRAQG